MKRLIGFVALFACVAIMGTAPVAGAFDMGGVQIHGFGNWYYGKSDGNAYLGDEDGDYDTADFSLSFSAQPIEKTFIHIQPFWGLGDEGVETSLDIGMAEYQFSDLLRFRVGVMRHPFGIYPEILEVGTLRPFMVLPSGLYSDAAGIVSENYNGVGITGEYYGAGGWGVRYDVYGGALNLESFQPWEGAEAEEGLEEESEEGVEDFELEDMIGARIVAVTPFDGLSFGASVYSGEHTGEAEGGALEGNRDTTFGLQLEYLTEKISARAEYASQDIEDEFETDAAYVELAYMITANLQAAARYDWSDTELQGRELETEGEAQESFLEHKEFAFGVNWWFSPNFVLKASYHLVDGNRFAVPEEGEGEEEEEIDEDTSVFLFGASFSF